MHNHAQVTILFILSKYLIIHYLFEVYALASLSLCVCMFHRVHVGACRNQRRNRIPLEMELQTIVSYHVGTDKQTQVSARPVSAVNCWTTSLALVEQIILIVGSEYERKQASF